MNKVKGIAVIGILAWTIFLMIYLLYIGIS